MPKYLIRGWDEDGCLQAEEEIECSDDEFSDCFSDTVIQPAYLGCTLVSAFELRPVKHLTSDEYLGPKSKDYL
jgi:hypothetical protein